MRTKRWVIVAILLGILAILSLGSFGQGVEPKGIIIKPPDTSGLTAQIWVDKGAYTVGEKIQIHYKVNQEAYVYIYDIDAGGKVSLIFPNYYSQNNRVSAGEHVLPDKSSYSLTVVEPTGTEHLQIVASKQQLSLVPQFQISVPFPLLGSNPDAFKLQIQGKIQGIVPEAQWAEDWTSFQVVSGAPPAYATLALTSSPSAAWITVDGNYVGYTPRTLHVQQGYHEIVVGKTGYENWSRGLFLIGGYTRNLNAVLTPSAPANQPPVASFTFSPANPAVGGWVQFNASGSSDPDGSISNYHWNFGDGSTDTGVTRYHQFTSAGTYTVTLTVTDNKGATDSTTRTIRVGPSNQAPNASFTYSPSNPAVGGWVQFDASGSSDPDGTITTYSWTFGDGGTGTGLTRYHQYASAGTYTVTLTVTDNQGATDSTTRTIRVGPTNQPPVATFTVSPANPNVSQWVRFDASGSSDPDGSISSYQWNFGDGSTDTGVTRYHQYASAGTYTVTLTVTDNQGATDSTTRTVRVGPTNQPPVALFTYSPSSPGIGVPITLNATSSHDPDGSITAYQWDLDNNGTVDATGPIVTFSYYNVGVHMVRLTVVDNHGVSASTTQGIMVVSGGTPGQPAMGGTPGIFVWGTNTWHVTVNAAPGWTTAHSYRIELRTDGTFKSVNQAPSGPVVPLGVVPTPTDSGKTLVFQGKLTSGSVDYTFSVSGSKSIWMSLKLDVNGDGSLDESPSFVYLRGSMVHPPTVPFVVGLPEGATGQLVPSMNFRIGSAITYTSTVRFVLWMTDIAALESH
jgi:PKD repeat protein